MSYQALYRKWRPERFADIVGQDRIVTTLINQITSGRIPHAYLFCGSRGTGKTSTSKVLARAINCLNNQHGEPCGECEACRQLAGENNLDVVEIDAASNNGVDEIRDLREKVKYPPTVGRYKVYIIDEVHMLSTGAFNALLKTLEEPPAHAVFILATTEPQKLPATILSRCQRFDFRRIPVSLIVRRLRQVLSDMGRDAQDEAVSLIARSAEGGMRDALSLLDMCLSYCEGTLEASLVREVLGASDRSFLFAFVGDLLGSDTASALQKIGQVMSEGRDPAVFAREVTAHVRALLLALSCTDGLDDLLEITPEDAQLFTEQAALASQARLLRLMSLFMQAENDMKWASQQRAVLELYTVRACHPPEERSIEALEERLFALEKAISEGTIQAAPAAPQRAAQAASAPAQAPPPAPRRIPPESDDAAYKQALKLLFAAEPRLSLLLKKAQFNGLSGDQALLTFPGDGSDINAALLSQQDKKQAVDKALSEAFGREVHAQFGSGAPAAPTGPTKDARQKLDAVYDAFPRESIELTDDPG